MVVILVVVVVLVGGVAVVVEVMEVTMVVEGPVASEWRWWFSGLCWILVVLALTLAQALTMQSHANQLYPHTSTDHERASSDSTVTLRDVDVCRLQSGKDRYKSATPKTPKAKTERTAQRQSMRRSAGQAFARSPLTTRTKYEMNNAKHTQQRILVLHQQATPRYWHRALVALAQRHHRAKQGGTNPSACRLQ